MKQAQTVSAIRPRTGVRVPRLWLILPALATLVPVCSAAFDPETGAITDARWRSGVPLGGIGCGAVEILTDGALGNATINHNWDRPTGVLRGSFAALRVKSGDWARARLLRMPLEDEYANTQSIRHTRYVGLYPRAEIQFADPDLPVEVALHAWSPLIPRNVKDSSLPLAFFDFTVRNTGEESAEVSVAMSWENLLGFGGRDGVDWDAREGNVQRPSRSGAWSGLLFSTSQSYPDAQQNTVGDYFLGAAEEAGVSVSVCPAWDVGGKAIPFWSSFVADGAVGALRPGESEGRQAGVVAAKASLAVGEAKRLRFILAWHMPTFRMTHRTEVVSEEFVQRQGAGNAAFDGDPATRWATGRGQKKGDELSIDLGAEKSVSEIVLDSAASPNDYPRGYRVDVAIDGAPWREVAAASAEEAQAAQQVGVLRIAFPPTRARRIRITTMGSHHHWFWSVYELTITGPDGPIDLSAATTSERLVKIATQERMTDVGHYYLRSLPDALAVAEYAHENRERLLAETRQWQELVSDSSLPFWLKLKLINSAFTMYSATVLTRDARFAVMESPVHMGGALGTMDQRMAAHAFYTQMFPSLDKSELELFAQCQQPDGRITHFNGNFHEIIGDPNVGYGITDWPDLSCSWIMQVLKLYRWTGDRAFLDEMWPHMKRVMAWLESADQDGDMIPEGGSTYDYEMLPRGAFVYSASCYLGALLAAEATAKTVADDGAARQYRERFAAVRQAVMRRLWNGEFFRKWRAAKGDAQNPNSFVAALAGDWLARLCGLQDTLAPEILDREIEQLIARHLKPFFPVPPMEVTPQGRLTTNACFLLQHEPYLGCEAIYRGFVDDGLEVLRRVYHCAWEKNESPWDQSLAYDAPSGRQGGLRSYMTCPTSWHVLNALSGVSLDAPAQTLYISPRVGGDLPELHAPVFLGTFWAWVDYAPARRTLSLRIIKVFQDAPPAISRIARDGNAPLIQLPEPLRIAPGESLDLSRHIPALAPFPRSQQVSWQVNPPLEPRTGLSAEGWRVSAHSPGKPRADDDPPEDAVDGDAATRWSTGRAMSPGDWFCVDLRSIRRIAGVWVDIARSKNDYPRGYDVAISLDGEAWEVVAEGDEGASRRSVRHGIWRVGFEPVQARFVRITQRGSHGAWWWSIRELYVLPEGYRAPPPSGKLHVQEKMEARAE